MEAKKKLELVERATWECAEPEAGSEIVSSSKWFQVTTPGGQVFWNGVLRCEIPAREIENKMVSSAAPQSVDPS